MIITPKDGPHGFLQGVNGYLHPLGAAMLERFIKPMGCAGLLCAAGTFSSGQARATECITLKNGEEVRCDIIKREDDGVRVRLADGSTMLLGKVSIESIVHEDDRNVYKEPDKKPAHQTAEAQPAVEPDKKATVPAPAPVAKEPDPPKKDEFKAQQPTEYEERLGKLLKNPASSSKDILAAIDDLLANDTLPAKDKDPMDYLTMAKMNTARKQYVSALRLYDLQLRENERWNNPDLDAQAPDIYAAMAACVVGIANAHYKDNRQADLKPYYSYFKALAGLAQSTAKDSGADSKVQQDLRRRISDMDTIIYARINMQDARKRDVSSIVDTASYMSLEKAIDEIKTGSGMDPTWLIDIKKKRDAQMHK
jgi:hypothetical protein